MPAYNDASLPYGSVVLSINSVNYVAENISFTTGSVVPEIFSEVGIPSGQVVIPTFASGSAQLQLATTSTAVPTVGMTFDEDLGRGTAERWVITEVGRTYESQSINKVPISFREVINAGS